MKKNKLLMYGLIAFALFYGVTTVEAKSYTTYKVGDEITVNLNNTLKEKFYVIENNDDSVKAIYKSTLGNDVEWLADITSCVFKDSVVEKALKERTATWSNATNVILPTANDIAGEFDYTSQAEFEKLIEKTKQDGDAGGVNLEKLTSVPSYALNIEKGTQYFTNSVLDYNDSGNSCQIYIYGRHDLLTNEYAYLSISTATENTASIRPVITVSKDNVVGGTYISEEETLWTNFIDAFKKTELLDMIKETEGNTVDITSTADSLEIVLGIDKNSFTTNFTYADGVITYVPSSDENNLIADNFWIVNSLYALSSLKGYDIEKMFIWIEEDRKFTLKTDGIEFATKEINIEETNSMMDFSLSGEVYTSFKMDIKDGLKTFSNKKEEVTENPKTGDATAYIILGLGATLIIATVAYMKSKKYSTIPQ